MLVSGGICVIFQREFLPSVKTVQVVSSIELFPCCSCPLHDEYI